MGIIDNTKAWFLRVAIQKALKRAIPWLITGAGLLVTRGNDVTGKYGFTVTLDTAALGTAAALALAGFQNWVKVKTGAKWL